MKTVAYVRNSITQEIQKHSISYQSDRAKEVAYKNQLVIDHWYVDAETSARKNKTEQMRQLQLLLAAIENGQVDNLLVYARDRLARQSREHMKLYKIFKNYNINVIFTADNQVPMIYSKEGELIERILAAFAEQEGDMKVQRLVESKESRAREGKNPAGKYPYGFKANDKKPGEYVPIQEELDIVKLIYQEFLQNDFKTLAEFHRLIQSRKLLYRGEPWTYANLRSVLLNPIYDGRREYHSRGEVITTEPEGVKKILDDGIFDLAQMKLEKYQRGPRQKNDKLNVHFLLDGLVYCKQCEAPSKTSKYPYKGRIRAHYRCDIHEWKIEKNRLEEKIIESSNEFFAVLLNKDLRYFSEASTKKQIETLLQSVVELKQQITLMKSMIIGKTQQWINSKDVKLQRELLENYAKLRDKEDRKENLEHDIRELNELPKRIKNMEQIVLPILTVDMSHELLTSLLDDIISEIWIDGKGNMKVSFKNPFYAEVSTIEVI